MKSLSQKRNLFFLSFVTLVAFGTMSCGAPQSEQSNNTNTSTTSSSSESSNKSEELPAFDAYSDRSDPSDDARPEIASVDDPASDSSTRSISIYNPNAGNIVPTGGNLLNSFFSGASPSIQIPDKNLPPTIGGVSSYLYCYFNKVVNPKAGVSYNQIGGTWALDPNTYRWYHPWYSSYVLKGNRFIDGSVQSFDTATNLINACKLAIPSDSQFAYYSESASSLDFERPVWSSDEVPATRFRSIVAFGDSLSDIGNDYLRTTGTTAVGTKVVAVPNTPFWGGRFTSGFNWVDYLSFYLHISVFNWAYGGAESSNIVSGNLPMAVQDQISDYISKQGKGYSCLYSTSGCLYGGYGDPAHTLFSILIGGNNYLDYTQATPMLFANSTSTSSGSVQTQDVFISRTVDDIQSAVERLVGIGARYFIIPTLPDLSKVPLALNRTYMAESTSAQLGIITQKHNVQLIQRMQNLKSYYSSQGINLTIISMDLNGILKQVMAKPSSYGGFTNFFDKMNGGSSATTIISDVSTPCYPNLMKTSDVAAAVNSSLGSLVKMLSVGGLITNTYMNNYETNEAKTLLCSNTESHVFFDNIHPTTAVHGLLAYGLQQYLKTNYPR